MVEGHTFIFDFSSSLANLKSRDNKVECVTSVSLVGISLLVNNKVILKYRGHLQACTYDHNIHVLLVFAVVFASRYEVHDLSIAVASLGTAGFTMKL